MKPASRSLTILACLAGFAFPAAAEPPKKPGTKPPAKPAANKPAPASPPATPAPEKPDPFARQAPVIAFSSVNSTAELAARLPKEIATPRTMALLGALRSGYPEAITGVALSTDSKQLFIVAADGSRHLFDDGKSKSPEQLLADADVEDLFSHNYPLTNPTDRLPADFDPGRARPDSFFRALYGATPEAVRKNLTSVSFGGRTFQFNRQWGAAEALAAAGRDIDEVVRRKPELKIWLANPGGTWNWRKIEGTERLSTHSFGIAIDLNTDKSKYWRWEKPATLTTFSRLDFPVEIIEAFERNGFIWGGKWFHYDTMHFEYRPEILAAAKSEAPAASPPRANPVMDPAAPAAATTRRALLIDPQPALPDKPRGSEALKANLERCGFTVTRVTGGDLGACIENIEKFATAADAPDALLFHFSGDAMHHNGATFLLPAGAKIGKPDDVFAEAIPLKRVVESLSTAKTAARIILLDTPPVPASAPESGSPAELFRTPGFFFGFAGSPAAAGSRAWQPDVFTSCLAARIASPDVSVSDMFTFVIQDVERSSGGIQKPQSASTLPAIFRFAATAKPETPPAPPSPPTPPKAKPD